MQYSIDVIIVVLDRHGEVSHLCTHWTYVAYCPVRGGYSGMADGLSQQDRVLQII